MKLAPKPWNNPFEKRAMGCPKGSYKAYVFDTNAVRSVSWRRLRKASNKAERGIKPAGRIERIVKRRHDDHAYFSDPMGMHYGLNK